MAERDPQLRRNRPSADEDYAAWIGHQVDALKQGRFDELDIEELAGEVDSLGKRDFKELRSALRVIILHMLKWDYQPERRDVSWRKSINAARRRVWGELESSPSFRSRIEEAISFAFPHAREQAWEETGVHKLQSEPQSCPYSFDDLMFRPHELAPDRVPKPSKGDIACHED